MKASPTFRVEVADVGTFTFRRRAMRDHVRLFAEIERILGGPCEDKDTQHAAEALASLSLLTVSGPDGWDLDALDPLDPDDVAKLFKVYRRLRDEEERFRQGAGA